MNRHIADCEVKLDHNKKDLIKTKDRIIQENKNIENQKNTLEKNDSDLQFKRKEL